MPQTPLQRLAELERWQRNVFMEGTVFKANDSQAQVDIGTAGNTLVSSWLPLVGRDQVQAGEPVLLVCPNGDPALAYVLALAADPRVDELRLQVDQLAQQLTQLQQTVSSGA